MKTKPIVIVRMPNRLEILDVATPFKALEKDYHILIIEELRDDIAINVFYEKDFNKVKYEELKEIIKKKYDK